MALLQVNFNSATLHRKVPMQVILPTDAMNGSAGPFKTLYLLHGLTDNYLGWTSNTRIERWAMERNLAVVMPSAENSFYVDMPYGTSCFGDFGAYVGQEIVEMTRKMFRLSSKRENTFIAGLSMGGFGALRNGLKYVDTFGYIACLSGAIHIFEYPFDEPERNIIGEDACFGDIRVAALTDRNPRVAAAVLFDRIKSGGDITFPKVYIACGTEDYLLRANRQFADFLKANGADVTYEEGPGGHDWEFWDTYIQRVLAWLPIEKIT
ncbi:MAG: alpha/beta hydrolase family protein [Caldilineaceae bacterium]